MSNEQHKANAALAGSAAPSKPHLVVMLDWENFPGIRSADGPLPLATIIDFLKNHFELRSLIGYSYRKAMSARSEAMLAELGFEIRLLDQLLESNDKKNSLDLCLAMDAVRLAYTDSPTSFALLVAGDADFAMVSAFIRRRLGYRVLAFGSSYCPNPSLERQVDRYFLLERATDWEMQLLQTADEARCSDAGQTQTGAQACSAVPPELIEALRKVGARLPMSLGRLGPALRGRQDAKPYAGKLWNFLQRCGCTLSEDRQRVLAWSPQILQTLRGQQPAERRAKALRVVSEELGHSLRSLGQRARLPVELSVLREGMRSEELAKVLSHRVKLWQLLVELGFELNDSHTQLLSATSKPAQDLLGQATERQQLALFDAAGQAVASPAAQPDELSHPGDAEAAELALSAPLLRRLHATNLPVPRAAFLRLLGSPQLALPFDEES